MSTVWALLSDVSCRVRQPVDDGDFYRVSFGARSDTVLVLSRRKLIAIDISVRRYLSYLSLSSDAQNTSGPRYEDLICLDDGSQFTGLDRSAAARHAAFTCLTTTRQLIWIDEFRPGYSPLRWDHDFGGGSATDIALAVIGQPQHSMGQGQTGEELVVLSSSSVEYVLGVRISTGSKLAVACLPWCVQLESHGHQALRSLVPLQPLANHSASVVFVLGLQYLDGSVVFIEVVHGTPRSTGLPYPERTTASPHWGPDLSQLEANHQKAMLSVNDVAATRYASLHGRWAWQGTREFDLS